MTAFGSPWTAIALYNISKSWASSVGLHCLIPVVLACLFGSQTPRGARCCAPSRLSTLSRHGAQAWPSGSETSWWPTHRRFLRSKSLERGCATQKEVSPTGNGGAWPELSVALPFAFEGADLGSTAMPEPEPSSCEDRSPRAGWASPVGAPGWTTPLEDGAHQRLRSPCTHQFLISRDQQSTLFPAPVFGPNDGVHLTPPCTPTSDPPIAHWTRSPGCTDRPPRIG